MLTDFSFANYRAFRRGQIYIKPLTIIVGANSVGKTALLQVPLLVKQSAILGDSKFRGALRVHGRDVSFGQPRQLFHNLNTSTDLELEYGFRSAKLLRDISDEMVDDLASTIIGYCEYALFVATQVKPTTKLDPHVFKQVTIAKDIIEKFVQTEPRSVKQKDVSWFTSLHSVIEPVVFLIKTLSNDNNTDFIISPHVSTKNQRISITQRILISQRILQSPISSISEVDLRRIIIYCVALRQLESEEFSVRFSFGLTKSVDQADQGGTLFVKSVSAKNRGNIIFGLTLSETQVLAVQSQLIDEKHVDNRHSDLTKSINFGASIFGLFDGLVANRNISSSTNIIRNVIAYCIRELQQNVTGTLIEHIGPLRAYPKRFYFLDQNYSAQSGELVVEKLREDKDLVRRVNFWLKTFRITISVSQLVEIISRLSVRNESASFDLDITDVGFGISQFLPILVEGLLAPPQRTLIIEQPEIHLHPKMQAELADFFIDIANIKKKNRQRRRISLTTGR
jgi:hypothetical protein